MNTTLQLLPTKPRMACVCCQYLHVRLEKQSTPRSLQLLPTKRSCLVTAAAACNLAAPVVLLQQTWNWENASLGRPPDPTFTLRPAFPPSP